MRRRRAARLAKRFVLRWRRRFAAFAGGASSETLSLVGSAIVVGSLAGLAAVAFDALVGGTGTLVGTLRGRIGWLPAAVVTVATPALGGLLVAPIVLRFAPDARGSGPSAA